MISVNLVFQTQTVGLEPFELLMVGTVLELSTFIFEVPTGVFADTYGRRASVVIGLLLVGAGLALGGVASFAVILAAQVVWGFGYTFISGAQQAWIADEIGVEQAAPVYIRSAQYEQFARLVAIPVGIGIATLELNLPILIGGGLVMALGLLMALAMPEQGFKRPEGAKLRPSYAAMRQTFVGGARAVRGNSMLLTLFAIVPFYGMASEGFDRLWVIHFFRNLDFPTAGNLEPVVWIGAVRMGSAVLGIFALRLVRRLLNPSDQGQISRGLFFLNQLQLVSIFWLAASGNFYVGMVAFWSAVALSRAVGPLYIAWINLNVDSSVRATVISFGSQMNSLGQITGGPALGAIGSLVSIKAALFTAGAAFLPALPLYMRTFKPPSRDDPLAKHPAEAQS